MPDSDRARVDVLNRVEAVIRASRFRGYSSHCYAALIGSLYHEISAEIAAQPSGEKNA